MLGGPSWPPKNVTERAVTIPWVMPPGRSHCHLPDSSLVGEPTANRKSTFRIDELSLIRSCTVRWSPSRTPRTAPEEETTMTDKKHEPKHEPAKKKAEPAKKEHGEHDTPARPRGTLRQPTDKKPANSI